VMFFLFFAGKIAVVVRIRFYASESHKRFMDVLCLEIPDSEVPMDGQGERHVEPNRKRKKAGSSAEIGIYRKCRH
jgi:hypothetical protein